MNHKYRERLKKRFQTKRLIDEVSGCWLWTGAIVNGYGRTGYTVDGRNTNESVHRVAYETYNGEIPKGMVVRHTCDVKHCCNPDHLVVGTHRDNSRDAVERGLIILGEQHKHSKLTESQILEIRASNETQANLARQYDVSPAWIGRILKREVWKHI